MRILPGILGALLVGVSVGAALAAAGADPASVASPAIVAPDSFKFDTEMTVENWFLCISQPQAETLVKAREESVDAAQKAYAQLSAAKSCGQFNEMHVILQKAVYESAPDSDFRGHIFNALVKFSGSWANGYVISVGEQ